MNIGNLVKINIYTISLYIISILLNTKLGISFPQNLLGLTVFFLFGLNIAALLSYSIKKRLDTWEVASISFLASLLIYPAILVIEYALLKKVFNWLPLLNFIATYILLFGWSNLYKKTEWVFLEKIELNSKKIIYSPIAWVFFIGILVIIYTFSTFSFLPDKDPFTWLFQFQESYAKNILGKLSYRPFFSSLTFSITKLSGLSIFIFFKYILPFFYLATIFPACLIIKIFNRKEERLIFLLSIFASANLILYAQTPMPQAPFIWLCFYFIFFLIYDSLQKDTFWFYLAGFISFAALFYHEASIIIFSTWLIALLWKKKEKIWKNKGYFILITLLIISNLDLTGQYAKFSLKWIGRIIKLTFHPNPNWLYPLSYKNVDGNQMGWGNAEGIIKFYGYYSGIFFFALIAILLWLLFKKRKNIKNSFASFIKNENILALIIIFSLFFCIAEVFPRFPGIAMLPDRSWIFVSIFSITILFFLLKINQKKWIVYFLIFSILINIFGSLYINNQKKYLITEAEIKSAKWAKKNLPENKLFITSGSRNLLKFYADSKIINVTPEIFYEEKLGLFFNELSLNKTNFQYFKYNLNFEKYADNLNKIREESTTKYNKINDDLEKFYLASNYAKENIKLSNQFLKKIKERKKNSTLIISENIYIYYSQGGNKNPYLDRPYNKKSELENKFGCNDIVLNKYPEKFEKIYEDKENGIIIWKIL